MSTPPAAAGKDLPAPISVFEAVATSSEHRVMSVEDLNLFGVPNPKLDKKPAGC